MDKDKVFDFYEKIYFKELDEMNAILSRFPVLIAGTALTINAYIFLFNFKAFSDLSIWYKVVAVIVIIFAILGLFYCLYRTFKTNKYETLAPLEVLENKRQEYIVTEWAIKDRNKKVVNGVLQKEVLADELYQNDLQNKFIKCSDLNRVLNQKRRNWFHNSMLLIWINLILCISIPILLVIFNIGVIEMSDKGKENDPPLINIPKETETVSVRNRVIKSDNEYLSLIVNSKDKSKKKDNSDED